MTLKHESATKMSKVFFKKRLMKASRCEFYYPSFQNYSPGCREESVHHRVSFILCRLNKYIPWKTNNTQINNTMVKAAAIKSAISLNEALIFIAASRSSSNRVSTPSSPITEQIRRAFRNVVQRFTRDFCPPSSFWTGRK